MKRRSTGFLVMAITWIIVSLIWFFCAKNTVVGVIWLCTGILELVIALISRKKERK